MPPLGTFVASSAGIKSPDLELEKIEKYGSKIFYWIIPKGATVYMEGSLWIPTGIYIKDIKYIELD